MYSKGIVFFVATLFVLQVSGDAEDQWNKVQNWANKTIVEIQETIAKVVAVVEENAKEEQQRIQEVEAQISKQINEGIAALKERAQKAGADVSECFKELPAGGMDIAKNLTKGAIKCVTDEVDAARSIVTSLAALIKEINKTMEQAKVDFEACKSLSSALKVAVCQGKVAANAGIKEGQCAVEAGQLIAKASTLMSTAEATMQTCVAADLATAPIQMAGLLKNLGECVMNKIKGQ